MTSRSVPLSRLRSVALLLAGLLHLLSIPAEPVVHGWLHAPAGLIGWSADRSALDGAPVHQEACVVCQGINDHAVLESGAAPFASTARLRPPPAIGEPRPTSISRAQLQARAPPL